MNCGKLFPVCEEMYRHVLVNCECVLPVTHSGQHVCAHMMRARRPIWERNPNPHVAWLVDFVKNVEADA